MLPNKDTGINEVTVKKPESISYYEHEASMARAERQSKRLWIALIIAILLVFASNVGWLVYESLYDTITYQQDGGELNNINTGSQGDLTTDGSKIDDQTQTQP